MKNKKEQIDLLLQQNESEQLAGFNWDRLQTSISKKLDQADHDTTSLISYRHMFKIAAGIAAAAAVVFIAVIIQTDMLTTSRVENRSKAIGTFFVGQGSAKVKIIEPKEQDNQGKDRPSWIIIRTSEPKVEDNGQSRDDADFACLM